VTLKKGFDMPAIRRLEIERYARALDVADTDDFRRFLVAWQWHNPNSKDAAGALMMAAKRMGGAITAAEAEQVIEEADTVHKCRKADALGRYLRLTDETRTALQIRTIGSVDISKQQRARRRKEQKRALERARRRTQGAKPRTKYLATNAISRLQPWKYEGISRRTWYYRRKAAAQAPEQASTPLARPAPAGSGNSSPYQVVVLDLRRGHQTGQPLSGLSACTSPWARK
jgi:hypothetical protein